MIVSKTVLSVAAVLGLVVGTTLAVNIETVPVGNPGNAGDRRYAHWPGYGSVAYTYNIGKYEVTAGQYCEFLNAVAKIDTYGLYNAYMDTGVHSYGCNIQRISSGRGWGYTVGDGSPTDVANWGSRPVNFVSYWDACRFANWLHNGQPTGAQGPGTTETGAYTLNGYNGYDGRTIQRNANWEWAVTSEDEWYKAAYHKNDGVTGNYYEYPTSSDSVPGRDLNDVSGNNANYYIDSGLYPIDPPYYTTVAGEFQNSDSPYGTFDQGGNVWEWNEAIVDQTTTYAYRGTRGGAFGRDYYSFFLEAGYRRGCIPDTSADLFRTFGFRVVQVPEPTSMAILALGGIGMLVRRRGLGR